MGRYTAIKKIIHRVKGNKSKSHYSARAYQPIAGFTLFEFIITFALIVIVGSFIILLLNPAEQVAKARNNQRISHINTLASAVKERIIETRGNFGSNCASGPLPTSSMQIGTDAANYNLEICLIPNYLTTMPLDPSLGTPTSTGYTIYYATSTMQITISAPNAELGEIISVTR